jgi:FkbM family methyltransferase
MFEYIKNVRKNITSFDYFWLILFIIIRKFVGFLPELILTFRRVEKVNLKFPHKNVVKFKWKNHLVQLYLPNISNVHMFYMLYSSMSLFVKQEYKILNVRGKEVVDIGAYIGDSSIYFALNGAKRVYAFEPYPFSYRIAARNIKINKLKNKITLFNEAIGRNKGLIYIDKNYKNSPGAQVKNFKKGKKVKITTLREIIKRFKLKDAILKIDCEGCEYASILNAPNEVLRVFKEIMIEYHYGYINLMKKLLKAGFKVKVTRPIYTFNKEAKNPHTVVGFLYSYRQDK